MTPNKKQLMDEYLRLCLLGSIFSVCVLSREERARLLELYHLVVKPQLRTHNECH